MELSNAMRIGVKPGNSWIVRVYRGIRRGICGRVVGRLRRGWVCWWMSELEAGDGGEVDGGKEGVSG